MMPPEGGIETLNRADAFLRPVRRRAWQCLYFLPELQGHGSLRATLP